MLLKTIITTIFFLLFGLWAIFFNLKPQYNNFLTGLVLMYAINLLGELGQSLWLGDDEDECPKL